VSDSDDLRTSSRRKCLDVAAVSSRRMLSVLAYIFAAEQVSGRDTALTAAKTKSVKIVKQAEYNAEIFFQHLDGKAVASAGFSKIRRMVKLTVMARITTSTFPTRCALWAIRDVVGLTARSRCGMPHAARVPFTSTAQRCGRACCR